MDQGWIWTRGHIIPSTKAGMCQRQPGEFNRPLSGMGPGVYMEQVSIWTVPYRKHGGARMGKGSAAGRGGRQSFNSSYCHLYPPCSIWTSPYTVPLTPMPLTPDLPALPVCAARRYAARLGRQGAPPPPPRAALHREPGPGHLGPF